MTATPSSNRLKLTPSNSPFLTTRRPRSPLRGRPVFESRLSLKRVVGTTCRSPTAFDAVGTTFAYTAGGAVVVVHVDADQYTQRFYRARPNVASLYAASQNGPSAPTTTTTAPKANDSRNRVAAGYRDSHSAPDWADGSISRTWTSRERIKAATCLSLSPDGKYLAVGETGYSPRVLIFSLQDASSDIPLVSISEHAFGVNAVAWSEDSKYLASLGAANDGYLYVWKVDPRNGQTKLFQQNRCTSYVKDMVWLGNSLITLGIRHIKMWKIDENAGISPTKPKFASDHPPLSPTSQKTLPGRNIILGGLLEATFSCAAVDGSRFIICTEAGDVCILDGDDKQTKVVCILNLEFSISTIQIRGNVAYVGGKGGNFTKLDVVRLMDGSSDCIIGTSQSSTGLVALGFMMNNSVTIDAKGSIDIWDLDYMPGQTAGPSSHIHIPGHGEPVAGICPMDRLNEMQAAFLTWSSSGMVTFWDLAGKIKASISIPLEGLSAPDANPEPPNQLTCVKISKSGRLLVTADRLGVLRVTDTVTQECLLDTKAHSADCTSISLYEDGEKFLMACCGRDRTAQLFHRSSVSGNIEHFQTIEFAARVVQVLISSDDKVMTCSWDRIMHIHDLVTKEGDPDAIAAIPSKVVSLKASPTSMTVSLDSRTVFVSMLDRSVCQYDILTGRPINCFKCMDESSIESAVLESISIEQGSPRDSDFLLAASNTDKSIRLYDSISGSFLDREWGHTEAINGVCFVEDSDESRRVVSVAADGTIMIWSLDVHERMKSREPSPSRDATSGRPPLRKVLSKAELAEFQRPREGSTGQRSSPPPPLQIRTVRKRNSRLDLSSNTPGARTPSGTLRISPGASRTLDDTPSRRRGIDHTSSPPLSPRARLSRRPSLPALGHAARKKTSAPNLRGNTSLTAATEQTCRTLRAYRKKLSSAEPINPDALGELDQELRFTAAALGDRAIRSRAMNETVLSGLLDQYSERLVTLLDEKLRLTSQPIEQDTEVSSVDRRGSTDETSSTTSSR